MRRQKYTLQHDEKGWYYIREKYGYRVSKIHQTEDGAKAELAEYFLRIEQARQERKSGAASI